MQPNLVPTCRNHGAPSGLRRLSFPELALLPPENFLSYWASSKPKAYWMGGKRRPRRSPLTLPSVPSPSVPPPTSSMLKWAGPKLLVLPLPSSSRAVLSVASLHLCISRYFVAPSALLFIRSCFIFGLRLSLTVDTCPWFAFTSSCRYVQSVTRSKTSLLLAYSFTSYGHYVHYVHYVPSFHTSYFERKWEVRCSVGVKWVASLRT